MGSNLNVPEIVDTTSLRSFIHTVRDIQVMIDSDLATFYGVEPRRLNEQVKRNITRFPDTFRFQLTQIEYEALRSQTVTLIYVWCNSISQ